MANAIQQIVGTEMIWDSAGTDGTITFNGILTLAARQGTKEDLFDGGAFFARRYSVFFRTDSGGTGPGAGEPVELWWANSRHATAGTDNPGETSGTDAAYTDHDDRKKNLQLIGFLSMNGDSDLIQAAYFEFEPWARYGMPVVINNTAQTLGATAGDHIVAITPLVDEIQ